MTTSARILSTIPHGLGHGQHQKFYAEVAAPAPGSFTAKMYITIPDFSTEHVFAINGPWPAIYGGTLPAVGDPVLMEFDNRGNCRCLWWGGTFSPYSPIVDPDP